MLPRFLVAIHEPFLREQLRRFLTTRNFDVAVAADGLQCLEQLREGQPTVLVLDSQLQWGGSNGVLDYLSDEEPFQAVTVVLADGEHLDDILPRLRTLISQCHRCPCGLQDLQGFLSCLERLAWQIDRETDDASLELSVPKNPRCH
jgi:CheY-like chemotaxis protein